MRVKALGEIELVRRLTAPLRSGRSVIEKIGDDAAVIRWNRGKTLLFTSDMLIEDVHFTRRGTSAYRIGWKALAVNVSDIAAMGGQPRYAVVSIGVDPQLPVQFVDDIYRGMRALSRKCKIEIVGGDTNTSKKVIIDIALIGEAEKGRIITRRGAQSGDVILMTGSIGGGHARHDSFLPRVKEARWLAGHFKVRSMIDISDGLLIDLTRIARASGVGARLYKNLIPLSKDAGTFNAAVTAGEDFELLFTMSPAEAGRLFRKYPFPGFSTAISIIGHVVEREKGLRIIDSAGKARILRPKGYTHFK